MKSPESIVRFCIAPMGGSKTTWAQAHMNQAKSGPWVYVSPLLTETKRIIEGCPGAYFSAPETYYSKTIHQTVSKSASLLAMLQNGMNVAITHAMFTQLTPPMLDAIKEGHYKMMLDESPNCASALRLGRAALGTLFDTKQLSMGLPLNAAGRCNLLGTVHRVEPGRQGLPEDLALGMGGWNIGSGDHPWSVRRVVSLARSGKLFIVKGDHLIKMLSPRLITAFREVNVLTWLPDGSPFKSWLDLHHITYQVRTVEVDATGKPLLGLFDEGRDEDFKASIRDLLHVYEGNLNEIGTPRNGIEQPLSASWYDRADVATRELIRTKAESFFRRYKMPGTGTKHNMWTCPKLHRRSLLGRTFSAKHWLPCNARASNSYRERANLCFPLNVFPSVPMEAFFREMGAPLDRNKYALSSLLQWAWRSRLRMGEPVSLFLPSQRMRMVLADYLAQP